MEEMTRMMSSLLLQVFLSLLFVTDVISLIVAPSYEYEAIFHTKWAHLWRPRWADSLQFQLPAMEVVG